MKNRKYLIISFILCSFIGNIDAAKIKVACVGNSITGFHQYTYYATPLQHMLGDKYLVDNFGKGGSGVFKGFREELNEHEWAYINSTQCKDALDFNPDIVIIKFGANDANMSNFTKPDIDCKNVFKDDYTLLINKFKNLSSNPDIYICIPPAMFYPEGNLKDSLTGNFLGSFSNEVMHKFIRPAIKELTIELNIELIDFYTPTKEHPEFMPGDTGGWAPDWVHPDHRGHYVMALAAYEAIIGKPFQRPIVEREFIPDITKEYYIKNRKTGQVLECNSNIVNKNIVTAPLKVGDKAQLFKFENFSYNIYRIRHVLSSLQLKNTGSQVQIGDNPVDAPLSYGMYITPIEDGYYTIGLSNISLIGARTSSAVVTGNKTMEKLSDIDQWIFIEKDDITESSISTNPSSSINIKGDQGKIVMENIKDIKSLSIHNIVGKFISSHEVNASSLIVSMLPGIYIVSPSNTNFRGSKVVVK